MVYVFLIIVQRAIFEYLRNEDINVGTPCSKEMKDEIMVASVIDE